MIEANFTPKSNHFIYTKFRGEDLLTKFWWGWFGSESVCFKINKKI